MTASDLPGLLENAAAEVLENMFFTSIVGTAESAPGPCLSARLSFRGSPSGQFGIRTPMETARRIAANFLGLEEDVLTDAQTGEVVCELANMLCGSVLSRLESDSRFELSSPQLDSPEFGAAVSAPQHTANRGLEMEEGPIAVWLDLGQPV